MSEYALWDYFSAIEEDLVRTDRFVHVDKDNYKTYSVAFAQLLLVAGSEVDVVAKRLCRAIDSEKEPRNIDEYRQIICGKYPRFYQTIVDCDRYSLHIDPWREWVRDKNPSWWKAYNDVKHHRYEHFPDANLENVILAVSGLYALIGRLIPVRPGNSIFRFYSFEDINFPDEA